jgi:molybdopterin-containing oxidoreductase family iron-sulfur binding subunit
MPELDRRDFLRLVGVGAGAAAAAGCSDPIEKLVPYVIEPEEITPGIPVYYASTCRECPAACGLHVKTREGRPVKLEGNPEHPINRGRLCPRGQAGIGRTYHPDRYTGPMARGANGKLQPISWDDAEAMLVEKLRGSARRAWVFGADRGPSVNGIIDAFVSRVGAGGRVVYQPFAQEALRLASEQIFGTAVVPYFDVSTADLIVDFGSDFLDTGPSPVEAARHFAEAQDVHEHPDGGARLVSIGPRLSMTASNADQWLACAPGSEGLLAIALARAVFDRAKARGQTIRGDEGGIAASVRRANRKTAATQAGIDPAALDALVERLLAAKTPVVLPPGVAATGPGATSTAAAVLLLNSLLGAVGPRVKLPLQDAGPRSATLSEISVRIARRRDQRASRPGAARSDAARVLGRRGAS